MHGRTAQASTRAIPRAIAGFLAFALISSSCLCAHGQVPANPEDTNSPSSAPATPAAPANPYEGLKQPDPAHLTGTPVNFTGWLRRGSTMLQIGEYEGALEACRNAVMLEKDNIVAHILLGDVLVKLHRYPEAETEYQYVMGRQPTDASIVNKLGDLYFEQGNFVNAQNMYRKALSMNPKDPEAWINLARSFEGANELSSANDCYERVNREFPNSSQAKFAQSRITQLSKAQDQARAEKFFPIDGEMGSEGFGWWDLKKMPIHVYVDDGSQSKGFYQDMSQCVIKALQAWGNASRGAIHFVLDPPDRAKEDEWKAAEQQSKIVQLLRQSSLANMPNDPISSQIHIHWSDQLTGAVGRTWTSKLRDGNPTLSKAHIWLATDKLANGQKLPSQSSPATMPLFQAQQQQLDEVTMHEMGHALGLVHLSNPNDVMAPGLLGLRSGEPSNTRELSPRDVQALSEHYDYFRNASASPHSVSQTAQETSEPRSQTSESAFVPSLESGANRPEAASQSGEDNEESTTGGTTDGAGRGKLLSDARPGGERQINRGSSGATTYDPLREVMFLMNAKQYDKSLDTLNRLLARNANNPQAHYLRACVYVLLRQYPLAVQDYKQVLKFSPGSELGKRAAEGLRRINP